MTISEKHLAVELIQASFQKALASEPAYQEILPFFQAIYTMQAKAVENTRPAEITLSPEIIEARRTGEMPLIERSQITLDPSSAMFALHAILAAAKNANRPLADAAELLETYFDKDQSRLAQCHRMLLNADRDGLNRLCEDIGITAEVLDFFLYNSLWPSLARQTRSLAAKQSHNGNWAKGYCPICGALPKIAFLSETGQRFLVCRFCRHEWPTRRIQCPFCDNKDSETIGYHISADDKAHRIDTCDRCKSYLINVDTRQLPRDFYPPLEALVCTHLDIKAEQMGYQRAVDLNYQDVSPGVL
jgi:FdhE protein